MTTQLFISSSHHSNSFSHFRLPLHFLSLFLFPRYPQLSPLQFSFTPSFNSFLPNPSLCFTALFSAVPPLPSPLLLSPPLLISFPLSSPSSRPLLSPVMAHSEDFPNAQSTSTWRLPFRCFRLLLSTQVLPTPVCLRESCARAGVRFAPLHTALMQSGPRIQFERPRRHTTSRKRLRKTQDFLRLFSGLGSERNARDCSRENHNSFKAQGVALKNRPPFNCLINVQSCSRSMRHKSLPQACLAHSCIQLLLYM